MIVLGVYLVAALLVAVLTPPWEANDERDHVRNVETLVGGRMYRIGNEGGLESHQPPLYYLVLAGLQKAAGIPAIDTKDLTPPTDPERLSRRSGSCSLAPYCGGLFDHSRSREGRDTRLLVLLRLVSIALGASVVALTWAAARYVSNSSWTPVVAAAIVGTLPKFVFLSGVVNNDNLVQLFGAAFVATGLHGLTGRITRPLRVVRWAMTLGALIGLAVATKPTAVGLLLPGLGAVVVVGRRAAVAAKAAAAFLAVAILPVVPWILFTWHAYNDPFASDACSDVLPAGAARTDAGRRDETCLAR